VTSPKPVVLVLDADRGVRRLVRAVLRESGLRVVEATTSVEAVARAKATLPGVIVVDPTGPDLEVVAVLSALRETGNAGILVVSNSSWERDKVAALEAGADDYVVKPFGSAEFVARLRAVMRRAARWPQSPAGSTITVRGLQLDPEARLVTIDGAERRLTRLECRVLETLMRHAGKVVTQKRLLREIWGSQREGHSNYLREYVHQLRRKLEVDPAHPRYLITEPAVGYRIGKGEPPEAPASKPPMGQ
jgi:two-component system, OmpR family, KDP operon response regulator KdpE